MSNASLAASKKAITRTTEKTWYVYSRGSIDTGLGTIPNPVKGAAISGHMRIMRAMEVPNQFRDLAVRVYEFVYVAPLKTPVAEGSLLGNSTGSVMFDVKGIETSPSGGQSVGRLILTARQTT